jgi:uncharacterized protein (DUF952 family)
MTRIYHLALRDEWRAGEPYRRSTLGQSLDDVGFVHCSYAPQVQTIADLVSRDRDDVVLLEIDPSLLDAEVRDERADDDIDLFPHVYGPITPQAVVCVHDLALDDDGRLVLPRLLG